MAKEYLDYAGLQRYTAGLKTKLDAMFAGPLVANTAAAMTDTTRIYVYTGNETGYNTGHWYYYDGDSWEDGGVYQAAAVQTDTTLSIAGEAADAKATGDAIAAAKAAADALALAAFPRDAAAGAVASFPDGANGVPMESVVSQVVAAQSFNGYDRPWAGGAGKNQLENLLTTKRFPASGDTYLTYTVNADGSITLSGSLSVGSPHIEYLNSSFLCRAGVSYTINGWPADSGINGWLGVYPIDSTTSYGNDTGNGYTFSFEEDTTVRIGLRLPATVTDADAIVYPMIRLADTDPSFEPYENLCPITGREGATAYRTGKNLLRKRAAGTVEVNGLTVTTNEDGTVLINGTSTGAIITLRNHAQLANAGFGALAGQRLTLSGCPAGGSTSTYRIAWYDYDQPLTWSSDTGNGSTGVMMDFKSNPNMSLVIRVASGTVCDNLLFKPMIRALSDDDATYEPYQGNTYTASFGDTVYGGTLDLVTGVLTVSHGEIASYDGETINEPWISDRDVYEVGATPSTGAQVVYPLTTPTTAQLTPQEVATLLGWNNLWVDTGDVAVDYHADTALYIQKKIAEATA